MPTFVLFANTGIQIISTDIQCKEDVSVWTFVAEGVGWLRYRTINGTIHLAVDTRTGPAEQKCFAENENRIQKPAIRFQFTHLPDAGDIEIEIRSADDGTGMPKDVALVLDFGNCRTVGLLVEPGSMGGIRLPTQPFFLLPHCASGQPRQDQRYSINVFDSRMDFVFDPFPKVWVKVVREKPAIIEQQPARGILGRLAGKVETIIVSPPRVEETTENSGLFKDISPVRLGPEAKDKRRLHVASEGALTGMSSPKRYLWASAPIEDGYWHHILPEADGTGKKFETVHGEFFRYIYEDDRDWDQLPTLDRDHSPPEFPAQPRYPRRAMLTSCMYELITQAYAQINSLEYRERSGDVLRKRSLTDVVLSFPSGMCEDERSRYRVQVEKALRIFHSVHLSDAGIAAPRLRLETDEGTAGQLAFIYGELKSFGSAERWLDVVGKRAPDGRGHVARIACVDIGGGTTDLMIADYTDRAPGPATDLLCEVRHLDGVSIAGDEIVLNILRSIIIPKIIGDLSIHRDHARTFFEDVSDGAFNAAKRLWMTELWIPMVQAYLRLAEATNEHDAIIPSDVCQDERVFHGIETHLERITGARVASIGDKDSSISIRYSRESFARVVHASLSRVLWQAAQVVTCFDCDLVLLAGRTSALPVVQELFRKFLTLPESRVIALHKYEIGHWYPLQSTDTPGLIDDPKTVVVVGTAIEYLASTRYGLGDIRMTIQKQTASARSYYWGISSAERRCFSNDEALFIPQHAPPTEDAAALTMVGTRIIIGRRLSDNADAEVAPVYCISVDRDFDAGSLQLLLKRHRSATTGEEVLDLVSASGQVGRRNENGEEDPINAQIGTNVHMTLRTLFEDRYFLDTEAILGIDYETIAS